MSVVLITGASSGFGNLSARTLASAGHRVFAGVRDPADRGAAEAAALRAWSVETGADVQVLPLDVTQPDSVAAAMSVVIAAAGRMDVLYNNAGVAAAGLMETFSAEAVQRMFDVNVLGPERMLRAALPHLRAAGGGLVIQMSSTDGREVMPFLGIYNATKFAVEALSDAWRYELAAFGVEVSILQPGTFPTTSILKNCAPPDNAGVAPAYGDLARAPDGLFAALQQMVASGQAPDPQMVADAVLALVNAAPGTRPHRVVIDPSGFDGAARVNAVSAQVQADLLGRFGLGFLNRSPAAGQG